MRVGHWLRNLFLLVAALGILPLTAFAAVPVVKTVPWVASNPLIPHDAYAGKTVTLKGTADNTGYTYTWDFGDGSAVATGTVGDKYDVEASHAYTGTSGTIFSARLTLVNPATNESASKPYFVKLEDKTLNVETNIAIDEGLWYLHKTQNRTTSGGIDYGQWVSGYAAHSSYSGTAAGNVNAFEVNGHRESGSADNPYTETVARGMHFIFTQLAVRAIGLQGDPVNGGSYNPDVNGNGIGIFNPQYEAYQTGMYLDAIVSSGTPNAIAPNGPANVAGRKYLDIVQDMVDNISYCQYDASPGGAWYYSCNGYDDNSISQWMGIGLLGAQKFGATLPLHAGTPLPNVVPEWNKTWLKNSQATPNPPNFTNGGGYFGYQSSSPVWGPYAVTPSGMVQLVLDGIGRGNSPVGGPSWEGAETFLRENWDTPASSGAYYSIKGYYYGLFSFTKAMLLHAPGYVAQPITCLHSSMAGTTKKDTDWYAAEAGKLDSCSGAVASSDGLARTLIGSQNPAGFWYGHNYSSDQYPFETAWAIMMLNRTVFDSGVPVAVATATPNPAVNGQSITLSGTGSFHQDAAKSIVSWQWDFDNNGTFDASGPIVTHIFPGLGSYPVTLKVTDNGSPAVSASTIVTVNVSIPPLAPTANAGGPYAFCANRTPWYLDGSASVNPDDGKSEFGLPGDYIKLYAWDLDGNGTFGDVTGVKPDVTAYFTGKGVGSYLVQLKVTDNTAISFPSSGLGDLSSVASAQVVVRAAADPVCAACTKDLAARPKAGKVGLTWSKKAGVASYNVYRATVAGGPYSKIGNAVPTTLALVSYVDAPLINGTTYYYIVREVGLNGAENCQSNEAFAKPVL